MSEEKRRSQELWDEYQRLIAISAEQVMNRAAVIMCCYCSGDTTIIPDDVRQHVECERCGAQMLLSPRLRGGMHIKPICPGHRARNANRV